MVLKRWLSSGPGMNTTFTDGHGRRRRTPPTYWTTSRSPARRVSGGGVYRRTARPLHFNSPTL